ncbi:MAG: sodium:solute symporter family transporter [Phycisphaerae bacterium]
MTRPTSRSPHVLFSLLVLCVLTAPAAGQDSPAGRVELTDLPPLPVPLRGSFVGNVDGLVLVAGGFAEQPWAPDTWSREIYIYDPAGDAGWINAEASLPEPVAYGASAVGSQGLICLGGMTPDGMTNRVFRIRVIDKAKKSVEIGQGVKKIEGGYEGLPDLPYAIAYARAAVIDSILYLVGGRADPKEWLELISKGMDGDSQQEDPAESGGASEPAETLTIDSLNIDISSEGETAVSMEPANPIGLLAVALPQPVKPETGPLGPLKDVVKDWRRQEGKAPEWDIVKVDVEGPGLKGLALPAVGVRRDHIAEKGSLWILGGYREGQASKDVYRFIPGDTSLSGWTQWSSAPAPAAAISAVPVGESHLLVLTADHDQPAETLQDVLAFDVPSSLWLFHVVADSWVRMQQLENIRPGQLVNLPENKFALLAEAAETGAPVGRQGDLKYDKRLFGWLDYSAIVVYIVGMLAIGWYFSRKERNTDDYFLGGRKLPWWAAGLSIYATGISAISFMAIPAKTFHTDWAYIAQGFFPPIATVIVAYAFVPLLRRLEITTVMEYFEMRFSKTIRTIGSLQVILFQLIARMNIVLLLPSVALAAVTDVPVVWCIILMGVLATIYTVLGGINAVIWTDVAQIVVIFGGALLSIAILCFNVEGGIGGIIDIGMQFDKFTPVYTDFDLTIASIWVFSIWAIGDMFGRLGQESLQRAFATPDIKSARRSMITCGLISIPGTLVFYFLGSSLFAYYQQNPGQIDPTQGYDSVFPLFIGQKLPAGVAGLVIAGLFAAAMSTLDSGMHVVSTIVTKDWFAIDEDAPEQTRMRFARVVTTIAGGLATGMALYLSSFQKGSLWDTFIQVTALVGGGFGGVIVMAMLSWRVSSYGMLIGVIVGTLFTISLDINVLGYPFKPFVYGTFSLAVTCLVSWLISLAVPNQKDLTGLTVWTPRRDAVE